MGNHNNNKLKPRQINQYQSKINNKPKQPTINIYTTTPHQNQIYKLRPLKVLYPKHPRLKMNFKTVLNSEFEKSKSF